MGVIEKAVFTFTAPKAIKIHDPVLGVINRILQVAIIIYIIVWDLIINEGALHSEIPTGKTNFWGSQGDLASYQNKSWDYCSEYAKLNYADQLCRNERESGFGIFCEFNQRCRDYSFNEINIKGEDYMSFVTINKDITQHLGPCNDTFKDECNKGNPRDGETMVERYVNQTDDQDDNQDLESMFIYHDAGRGQCTCTNMVNYVVRGVEAVTLNFNHMFYLSKEFPEKCRTASQVPTFIHKKSDQYDSSGNVITNPADWKDSSCYDKNGKKMSPCMFSRELVSLRVEDLLKLSGLEDGLASRNEVGEVGRNPFDDSMELPFRTSGVEIRLDLHWSGSTDFLSGGASGSQCESKEGVNWSNRDEAPIKLYVVVSHIGGWHSFGSSVSYATYPEVDSDSVLTGVWHDNYKRGVKFRFTYGGEVKRYWVKLKHIFILACAAC